MYCNKVDTFLGHFLKAYLNMGMLNSQNLVLTNVTLKIHNFIRRGLHIYAVSMDMKMFEYQFRLMFSVS